MLDSIRQFVKRGRRGYSTADTYSFDGYLARVIAGGVAELRTRGIGHPADMTYEEWRLTLKLMERGFREYASTDTMTPNVSLALALFNRYFTSLWD